MGRGQAPVSHHGLQSRGEHRGIRDTNPSPSIKLRSGVGFTHNGVKYGLA
jgi:hypothetical protein